MSLYYKPILGRMSTIEQFDTIMEECLEIFMKKNADYGSSWRVMRPSSLTDQILIKIKRLRSIDEKGTQRVSDSIDLEFIGIINYAIMAIVQLKNNWEGELFESSDDLKSLYVSEINTARELLQAKNHDYGEAWRLMRLSSIIDIILMKVYRTKSIEQNGGKTIISEGLAANYQDMINYSVFGLIKLKEQ